MDSVNQSGPPTPIGGVGRGLRGRFWPTAVLSAAIVASVTGCATGGGAGPVSGSGGSSPTAVTFKPSQFQQSAKLSKSWLRIDESKHQVTVAVKLPANSLGLNGYSHGYAGIDVPTGWTVTVDFKNANGVLPGGLMVVTPHSVDSPHKPKPAIAGATMRNPFQGIGLNQTGSFTFQTASVGTYVLESVPSVVSGTWLWFIVTVGGKPMVLVKHV